MIYGVSPEEKQRREFFKNKAHILTKVRVCIHLLHELHSPARDAALNVTYCVLSHLHSTLSPSCPCLLRWLPSFADLLLPLLAPIHTAPRVRYSPTSLSLRLSNTPLSLHLSNTPLAWPLEQGLMFRLVATAAAEESFGKKLGSWFGGGKGGKGSSGKGGPLTDTDIWVSCDEDFEELEWRSMQNVEGKPKDSGVIKMSAIRTAKKEPPRTMTLLDSNSKLLLSAEGHSEADVNTFLQALNEGLTALKTDLDEGRTEDERKGNSALRRLNKWKEVEDRKVAAAAKKKALGNVGMKFTAQAMANMT